MSDYRYISVTDTAKLVRTALKKAFPRVKFSVRSDKYSMGASITVGWTDGPLASQVDRVVAPYRGAGFDGMIDLKYHKESWLMPDGTAFFGKCEGTTGSMGVVSSSQHLQPSFKAERVHFGADYIHTSREYSLAFTQRAGKRSLDASRSNAPKSRADAGRGSSKGPTSS